MRKLILYKLYLGQQRIQDFQSITLPNIISRNPPAYHSPANNRGAPCNWIIIPFINMNSPIASNTEEIIVLARHFHPHACDGHVLFLAIMSPHHSYYILYYINSLYIHHTHKFIYQYTFYYIMTQLADTLDTLVKDPARICTFDDTAEPCYQQAINGEDYVCSLTMSTDRQEALKLRAIIKCPHCIQKLVNYANICFYSICAYSQE